MEVAWTSADVSGNATSADVSANRTEVTDGGSDGVAEGAESDNCGLPQGGKSACVD